MLLYRARATQEQESTKAATWANFHISPHFIMHVVQCMSSFVSSPENNKRKAYSPTAVAFFLLIFSVNKELHNEVWGCIEIKAQFLPSLHDMEPSFDHEEGYGRSIKQSSQ